jgi:hypothetical protein
MFGGKIFMKDLDPASLNIVGGLDSLSARWFLFARLSLTASSPRLFACQPLPLQPSSLNSAHFVQYHGRAKQ